MRNLILAQCIDDTAEALGVCGDVDPGRAFCIRQLNQAQERLLNRANAPVGAKQRIRVCVSSDNCLVWPRAVRTIELFWLCNQPGLVVSDHHEAVGWNSGGYGLQDNTTGQCGGTLIDHGTACSFDNIQATIAEPRRIQAVASDPSDNGKFITLRYVDSTGQRVYSNIDGVVQEGERFVLSTSGVRTSKNVMSGGLYHVVKATTNYPVRLYSWDQNSSTQAALLALYEPGETVPIYRRSLIPGLSDTGSCCNNSSTDACAATKFVTVSVRLQHVPVVVDNDPLVIGNLPALIDMVRALKLRRDNYYAEADKMEANAMRELEGEQSAYTGDGVFLMPKFPELSAWGSGGISSSIGWSYGGYR